MYFGFDDDQEGFREAVAALLDTHCPPEVVRAAWSADELDRDVWARLTEMGVPAMLVPAADDGLGLDECAAVLVLEEAGRAGLPLPIVETVAVAPVLGLAVGDGTLVGTDLGGSNVPMAADVDLLILHDADAGALHVAPPDAVRLDALVAVDRSRRLARVEWEPSRDTFATDDPALVDLALWRGTFGTAAVLVGVARRMLDMTVEYVTQRQQFGVAIGSFQAVKHLLADVLRDLSFARPVVHHAAWSLASGAPTRDRDVSMAKLMASQAAVHAGRVALQCHGAIGYTTEHDLHLYLKRANALAATWGDDATHRARIGRTLGLHGTAAEWM